MFVIHPASRCNMLGVSNTDISGRDWMESKEKVIYSQVQNTRPLSEFRCVDASVFGVPIRFCQGCLWSEILYRTWSDESR